MKTRLQHRPLVSASPASLPLRSSTLPKYPSVPGWKFQSRGKLVSPSEGWGPFPGCHGSQTLGELPALRRLFELVLTSRQPASYDCPPNSHRRAFSAPDTLAFGRHCRIINPTCAYGSKSNHFYPGCIVHLIAILSLVARRALLSLALYLVRRSVLDLSSHIYALLPRVLHYVCVQSIRLVR